MTLNKPVCLDTFRDASQLRILRLRHQDRVDTWNVTILPLTRPKCVACLYPL